METHRPRNAEVGRGARAAVVREAQHLAAAARASALPPPEVTEIAIAGRSNVGKSSLLNALVGRRALARVSSTPGKTRLLHLYEVVLAPAPGAADPERLWLCDLPGYGWAKVSHSERESWGTMVTRYLVSRQSLRGLVALVDARRGVGEADERLLGLAAEARLPVLVVATKLDKLSKSERIPVMAGIAKQLAGRGARSLRPIGVSATAGLGLDDLWRALRKLAAGPARALVMAALAAGLALAALGGAPGAANAAAPAPAERVVDRILYVVGDGEVVTWTELQIEARLTFLNTVARESADARGALRFRAPLTMDLGRADLKGEIDSVLANRLLWVEARRLKKDRAPAEDVAKQLAALLALETEEAWDRFEVMWGATRETLRALIARDVAVHNFLYDHVYSRIKISREAALAYYDAHRAELPPTFAEAEEKINERLTEAERERRVKETVTALAKKHPIRPIGELP